MTHWSQETLLSTARGFMEARILLTAAELDLFTLLADEAMDLEEVTEVLESDTRATTILLDALAAMGLLAKAEGKYMCPPTLADLLRSDRETSVLPMLRHGASLWQRWSMLTDLVHGMMSEPPVQLSDDDGHIAAFIGAMHVIGRNAAGVIAEVARAESSRRLLDIGGATGTYAEAFLTRYPLMEATVFDRPQVIELAEARLANSPVRDRISLVAGDFYANELPDGHDLALLSAIIHQNSRAQNVELYRKVFRALLPGGRLLIRDHIMSEDHLEPMEGAVFAVNMLVATEGGDCYSLKEIQEDLDAAGFVGTRLIQSGKRMDGLVDTFKP